MAELRAALFDIDGTLVDSNRLHVAAWIEAFEEAGFRLREDQVAGLIGMGGDKLVPALWPEADKRERKHVADRHDAIFKTRYLAQAQPFPRARDLLVRTREAGLKVVFASSASQQEVDHYIDLLEARGLVLAATSTDDVDASKPAPDIFATALARAGEPAAAAIAIGDAPYDVEAASGSKLPTIGLLSGGYDEAALRGAVAIYADAADLYARFSASPLAT